MIEREVALLPEFFRPFKNMSRRREQSSLMLSRRGEAWWTRTHTFREMQHQPTAAMWDLQ